MPGTPIRIVSFERRSFSQVLYNIQSSERTRGTALKRNYANRRPGHKNNSPETRTARPGTSRAIGLSLDRDELLGLMQDSLETLAVELGLLVATAILEDEVTRLCGTRYQRPPGRSHTRYGHQRGVVLLGGQKLPIERPRVRRAGGGGEVPLETYAQLHSRMPSPKPCSGAWSGA